MKIKNLNKLQIEDLTKQQSKNIKIVLEDVYSKQRSMAVSVLDGSTKIDQALLLTSNVKQEPSKGKKIFNAINVVANIILNVLSFFFAKTLFAGFDFSSGLISYNFTALRILGLVILVLAQISGAILFVQFFMRQKVKMKLLIATGIPTLILFVGTYVMFNLNSFTSQGALAIKNTLNLTNFNPANVNISFLLLALAVYFVIIYIIYSLVLRKKKIKTK